MLYANDRAFVPNERQTPLWSRSRPRKGRGWPGRRVKGQRYGRNRPAISSQAHREDGGSNWGIIELPLNSSQNCIRNFPEIALVFTGNEDSLCTNFDCKLHTLGQGIYL
jgi:hypothetical protein